MEEQKMSDSKKKNKVNIEYPEVVQNHSENILHHSQSQHQQVKQPDVVFKEEDENTPQKKKALPHLKFSDQGKDNITMSSLGVRDQRQSVQPIFDAKDIQPRQSVLKEEEEGEDEQEDHKRLPHIDFQSKEQKTNIGFIGKKLDCNSPRNKSGSLHSSNSLKEIKENDEENKPSKFAQSPKQQKDFQKFHQNLQKIDQEISILEKESEVSPTGKFKRQKSFDNADIQETIIEQQDEEVQETTEQKHKQNALGGSLKKLEKQLDNTCLDDAELINRQRSGSENKKIIQQQLSNQQQDAIDENEAEDEEEKQ